MELIDGATLSSLLQKAAGLPEQIMGYVGTEILKGLRYLHEHRSQGLVHRDISPQNVLVGLSGEVKVSDFGIAKSTALPSKTASGILKGKSAYLAPELLEDHGVVSAASDQFAVGIVLWECLTGRRLFQGDSDYKILMQVQKCIIPQPSHTIHSISEGMKAVVLRMLEREPQNRFPSTGDALEALMAVPGYNPSPLPLSRLMRQHFPEITQDPAPVDLRTPAAPFTRTDVLASHPQPLVIVVSADTKHEAGVVAPGGTKVLPDAVAGGTKQLPNPASAFGIPMRPPMTYNPNLPHELLGGWSK
jgi:serine/threonine protein kinase